MGVGVADSYEFMRSCSDVFTQSQSNYRPYSTKSKEQNAVPRIPSHNGAIRIFC